MLEIIKLQLKTFLRSWVLVFIGIQFILMILMVGSGRIPLQFSLPSFIATDIAIISFFQFGSDYQKFKTSFLSKKMITSSVNHQMYDLVYITFSIFLSFIMSMLYIIIAFAIISFVPQLPPGVSIATFWWGWYVYWVIIFSILNISFAYFFLKFIKSQTILFGFFAFMSIIIWSPFGGIYSTNLIISSSGEVIGVTRNTYTFAQHFLPQFYANQSIVNAFNANYSKFDNLKLGNVFSYSYKEQYLYLIMPYVFIVIGFLVPKILCED